MLSNANLLIVIAVLIIWLGISRGRRLMGAAPGCPGCISVTAAVPDPAYPVTGGLYPLRHPLFCAREAAKNMALLEDHFADPRRRCTDCAKKHLLLIEGFLEEGLLMDRHRKFHSVILPPLERIRVVTKRFVDGVDPGVLAQEIRDIRKPLADHSFEYFQ